MLVFYKKFITLILITSVMNFSLPAQAASLTQASDTMSSHNAGKMSVTHTIRFLPATNITGPGDLRITFATGIDLTDIIASSYVTVTGGGVTWDTVQNNNLMGNVLTLGWSSGTLTAGNQVQVVIHYAKNPVSVGNYNITLETGIHEFLNPIDSRVITTIITNGDVAVTATVPAAAANPIISNVQPGGTIIVSNGGTKVINFTLTDANDDNIAYTITPLVGSVSVAPSPASPVSGTISGKVITFTYLHSGATGAQTITLTADDAEPTGGGLVTYTIQLFII